VRSAEGVLYTVPARHTAESQYAAVSQITQVGGGDLRGSSTRQRLGSAKSTESGSIVYDASLGAESSAAALHDEVGQYKVPSKDAGDVGEYANVKGTNDDAGESSDEEFV